MVIAMSKPYCRQNNPLNNGNDNNIIIDFHECDYVHTHELFQTVLLMFCYYIASKMLNYYSPLQNKQKNQQVNEVLFTPERYVGISVKIPNTLDLISSAVDKRA
jgi:hypothetical protein